MWQETLEAPSELVQGMLEAPLEQWRWVQASLELAQAWLEQGEEGRLQAPSEFAWVRLEQGAE